MSALLVLVSVMVPVALGLAPASLDGHARSMARGQVLAGRGDLAGARAAFEAALAEAKSIGAEREAGVAAEAAASVAFSTGDRSSASSLFTAALESYRAVGDVDGMIAVHRRLGELGDARQHQDAIARLERGDLSEQPDIQAAPPRPAEAPAQPPPYIPPSPDPSPEPTPEPDDDDDDDASWLGTLVAVAAVAATGIALGVAALGGGGETVRIGVELPEPRRE